MRSAALLLLLALTAPAQTPDYNADGKLWWSHIQYLAGDELQGRQTGSPGYDKGADYVVATSSSTASSPPEATASSSPSAST